MGYLNSEKPPEKWSSAWFKMFVERVKLAVNDLDINNFPTGINGALINDKSLSFESIGNAYYLSKLRQLDGLELQYVFFANTIPFSVSSLALTNVGGYVLFDDVLFTNDNIKLYFEATFSSADNTSTATLELHGVGGKLAELTTNTGNMDWKRSEAFTPPTGTQTLLVKAKTSDGNKPASLLSARLILKIN